MTRNAADLHRSYRRVAERHPPLTRAEEVALARRARTGETAAHEALFNHNVAFALMLARQWSTGSGVGLDDLTQEAMIGLHKAVERFDPNKGNRFTSYAAWWIRAYLGKHIREFRTTIRPPSNEKPGQPKHVRLIQSSLDAPVNGEDGMTFLDFLADASADPAWDVVRKDVAERVRARLAIRFKQMRGMEQDIILYRLMSNEKNLEDIGDEWGLSRERIRQLQKQLLPKLRRLLAGFEEH